MLAMGFVAPSFFFSSRRRHTRLVSDWSSDVCSSDLHRRPSTAAAGKTCLMSYSTCLLLHSRQIGRASCRERGESSGDGEPFKKKEEGAGEGREQYVASEVRSEAGRQCEGP